MNLHQVRLEGLSKTKAETSLFRAIRLFIPLSERVYNGSCQDTVMFGSYTEHTRLMSETNVKLLYALLSSKNTENHKVV